MHELYDKNIQVLSSLKLAVVLFSNISLKLHFYLTKARANCPDIEKRSFEKHSYFELFKAVIYTLNEVLGKFVQIRRISYKSFKYEFEKLVLRLKKMIKSF